MRRVYRPTLALRLILGGLGAGLILLCLFLLAVASFADGSTNERIGTIAFALLLGIVGAVELSLIRVRLVAGDTGVEVVNYVSRRRFRWDEIDRFEVGFAYIGISLVPLRAAPIKVNAIQKTNLYHWLRKRGRADRIVDELNALLAEWRVVPLPPPP